MIEFTKKSRGNRRSTGTLLVDVSVTIGSASKTRKKDHLRFSFSEKARKMIAGDGFFVVAGTDRGFPGRIYFSPAKEAIGFKLGYSGRNKDAGVHTRCSAVFGDFEPIIPISKFVGYYSLEYDPKANLLYIDSKNKMEVTEL